MVILHLAGALIVHEHFLERSALLTQKRRFVFVTLHIWVNVPTTNVLMEHFLQRNVPFRHLLNEDGVLPSKK